MNAHCYEISFQSWHVDFNMKRPLMSHTFTITIDQKNTASDKWLKCEYFIGKNFHLNEGFVV